MAQQQQSRMHELLQEGMDQLNPRERMIVASRFLAERGETLETLGEKLEISRERVRQIEAAALKKLKKFFQQTPDGYELVAAIG